MAFEAQYSGRSKNSQIEFEKILSARQTGSNWDHKVENKQWGDMVFHIEKDFAEAIGNLG